MLALAPGELRTAQGTHRFDHVFDVRGVGARATLPVRGVRGEIFWLHAPGVGLQRPVRLLHPRHRVYLVPRPGDLIVVGASEIESEDRSPVSLRSTVELLAAALERHGVVPQRGEVLQLQAQVLDVAQEAQRYLVSVRFTGLLREDPNAAPEGITLFDANAQAVPRKHRRHRH